MKKIFGPNQKEVWQEFAKEIEGQYKEVGFFKANRIESKFENWTIVIDTYTQSSGKTSTVYTRIRIPFKIEEDFEFQMYSKSFFSDIGKALGMKDIEVGYKDFDDNFIIKGNNQEKLIELFKNERIRELIQRQKRVNLDIKDGKRLFNKELPEDVRVLYFYDMGVIKDSERLKNLYFLMVLLINQLSEIGVASKEDANITLK